jgi:O-antigen/teichoic acid export membrane protein
MAIPSGALAIAGGSVVSGVTAYVYLIVAARQLGPIRYSALSALWTLLFLAGPGCFAPLEQEVCRAAVARRTTGSGDRPAVVRAAQVGGLILVLLLAAVAATSGFLRHGVFGGHGVLVVALALGLAGYYLMHLSWGVLASQHHFRGYGVVAGSEGVVRLAICGVLLAVSSRSIGVYGLALGLAPFAAAYLGWRSEPVRLIAGSPEPWRITSRAIAYLLGASALKQFVLMVSPLAVQILATSAQRGAAGRYLAALALTRVPLFLFNAVLAALLPRLVQLASAGRRDEFGGILRRLSVVVSLAMVGAAVITAFVGPGLLRLFFGTEYALPAGDLVKLMVGCGAYMLALVLSYGLVAVGGHQWTTVSWGIGGIAFVVSVALGPRLGLLGRVEWGFLTATVAAATAMAALLVWRHRAHPWVVSDELIGETTT